MQKGVLSPLHLHEQLPLDSKGLTGTKGCDLPCKHAQRQYWGLNSSTMNIFSSFLLLLCCQSLRSNFSCWSFWKCLCAGEDLCIAAQCFLHQSCWEFLSISLTTRKLWRFLVLLMLFEVFGVFKLNIAAVAFHVCSPSKSTTAGGMAKWWASLPVVKPQHSLAKWAWCCFPSCLHWFVNPYSSESVILFLFLTLPLSWLWLLLCFGFGFRFQLRFYIFDTECEFRGGKK